MDSLIGRRIAVTMLSCLILLCFWALIGPMIIPALTGTPVVELEILEAYQTLVGIPIIGAITMLMCPAIIMILINTTQIELKLRILISRIISFAGVLTVFFLICLVNLALFIFANVTGMTELTIAYMAIMEVASFIAFLAYLTIFCLMTFGIKLESK